MRFFGVILILIGLPMCIVPVIGIPMIIIGLFMIIAGFGSSSANKTAKALAKQMKSMPSPLAVQGPSEADTQKWEALARYDDDVRSAVDQLQPYGAGALAQLRVAYLALNDKAKLPAIVADIQAAHSGKSR